jgi:hypothetical protein
MCLHSTKVKKALAPIPGARAKGTFAYKAIISVPKAEAKIVAIKIPSQGIPEFKERIVGFIKTTYAIVKNVVNPAIISV